MSKKYVNRVKKRKVYDPVLQLSEVSKLSEVLNTLKQGLQLL